MLKEAQQEKARLIENRVSDGTSFLIQRFIVVCLKKDLIRDKGIIRACLSIRNTAV